MTHIPSAATGLPLEHSANPALEPPYKFRIHSIDILRGLVMVIMALDHTRDFFHISAMTANPLDPATTTVPLFFTRWITHYCAPVFVFLSGLSIFLSSQSRSKLQASSFVIKRGLWLVLVEVTLVTLGLTFNPFFNFFILQVIWAIGWSMVLLGLLMRLSYTTVLVVGMLLVFGHNIFDYISLPKSGAGDVVVKIFFTSFGAVMPLGKDHLVGVFYAILPWMGTMCMGYAIGVWYSKTYDAAQRKLNLLVSGFAVILLFITLRFINGYGDPSPRLNYPTFVQNILSFLNTTKYPPSLMYTCMTLGPALLFLAVSENFTGRLAKVFGVYGSVPFFYYLLHFYLLHTILVIAFFASGYHADQIATIPFYFRPNDFGFTLPVVYAIWLFVVAALYLPCKWYSRYKRSHTYGWLRYL